MELESTSCRVQISNNSERPCSGTAESPSTPAEKNRVPVSAFPIASFRPSSPQARKLSAERISAASGTASIKSRLTRRLTPASAALVSIAARRFSGASRDSPAARPVKLCLRPLSALS
jgi:hypothetical protein